MPLAPSIVISRDRLIRLLDKAGRHQYLSLIAPAGFGKTTLMMDWTHRQTGTPVWLTIEQSDNDPIQFWTDLAMAFLERGYHTQACMESMSGTGHDVGSDQWLDRFFSELSAPSTDDGKPVALILDDLHHLENPAIIASLARAIWRLPAHINLYLLSRTRLPKGLFAHVPGNSFLQLNADDLAFSLDEGKQYLRALLESDFHKEPSTSVPTNLNSQLTKIWRKSEGWPVFFCSMANRWLNKTINTAGLETVPAHGEFQEYIEEKILRKLSPGVRELLVQLTPMNSFNRALVIQCLFPGESSDLFQQLFEQEGLLVDQPGSTGFYRIRQPLRDYLGSSCEWQATDKGNVNFGKAFKWYLANNAIHDAISLCVAGCYWLSVVHLIESQYRFLAKSGRWTEIAQWFDAIPEHIVRQRPLLLMLLAQKSLFDCAPMKAIVRLNQADNLLSTADKKIDHPDDLYTDAGKLALRVEVAELIASTQNLYLYDRLCPPAISLEGRFRLNGDSLLLDYQAGLGALYRNQLGDAKQILTQVLEHALAEHHGVLFQTIAVLGWVHYLTGEFDRWHSMVASLTARLSEHEGTYHPSGWINGSMVLTYLENGCIEKSTRCLDDASIFHGCSAPLDLSFRLLLKQVLLKTQQDRLDEASVILAEAEVRAHELPAIVRQSYFSIPALKAELLLKSGKLEAALHLLEAKVGESDEISLAGQHECLVMADILLALGQSQASLECFTRVKKWAESSGCNLLLMRALIGKAMIHQQMNQDEKALGVFHEALRLGRAMDSVDSFLKAAPAMKRLLSNAKGVARYPYYVSKLIALHGEDMTSPSDDDADISSLSKREKQILDLLATGMSNPEIADNLCRSLGTVKIHVHNIYRKLGASNRVMAINKYLNASTSNAA